MTVVVSENGSAPLDAGEGCTDVVAGVSCEVEGLYIVFAYLGDMDDRLDGSGLTEDQITARLAAGNDTMIGPPAEACVDGGSGDDQITLSGRTLGCSVDGDGGVDVLTGSVGRDNLYGGPGVDTITAAGGTDNVQGGPGADDLDGGAGNDYLGSDGGDDVATGGPGSDTFGEGGGDDLLQGEGGRDTFTLSLGPIDGDDELIGGSGRDAFSALCRTCSVTLDDEANDGKPGENDNVQVEDVLIKSSFFEDDEGILFTYGSGDDVIRGDPSINFLYGYRGDDEITGGGGPDNIRAGGGEDLVRALDGESDAVDCGKGEDTAIVDPFDNTTGCEEESAGR